MDTTAYLGMIANLEPGHHFVQTPDQRGDGYDIACAKHDLSLTDQIIALIEARNGSVDQLLAYGYPCAYIIDIPEALPTVTRIVTRCKGSWRWQEAFGVVRYQAIRSRTGKQYFVPEHVVIQKASYPQLKRYGYASLDHGSYNRVPFCGPLPRAAYQEMA